MSHARPFRGNICMKLFGEEFLELVAIWSRSTKKPINSVILVGSLSLITMVPKRRMVEKILRKEIRPMKATQCLAITF
ncbi:hypothetical protein BLNAU_2966 [Blattamonas nauphoetae]|uniref:Uncharacterized protein n=1 Tax=Blattamonas nauphoetae TaxID=2049346 RepID=A0ABQ9YDY9_9EUKA|nr:hypothetical protein BLNAU_2966 [Blattamonas nauphoetae]